MRIRAVFFDVGETLISESRVYAAWAAWLGVPELTLMGVLGGVIERRQDHLRAFELLRPGFDLAAEEAARRAAGVPNVFDERDLYPDARPCLERLHADGYAVGVAGNQPARASAALRAMGLPLDFVFTSEGWGVEKPSPAFFENVARAAGMPAGAIAYVGDRVDNDVVPAAAAGMCAVFLRRGPWGHLQASWPEASAAAARIDALAELHAVLSGP
jgi:HAD superfamily hydrolase (TIGR01549 family)